MTFAQAFTYTGSTKLFWYRSDVGVTLSGTSVSGWSDQSTNAYNIGQTGNTNRPGYLAIDKNFWPGITFNGAPGATYQVLNRLT